jgi:hypothetical protein
VTIFDYLKTITVTKKAIEQLEQYVPYLVTRWLSFINPSVCSYLNLANKQVLLENKDLHYKVLLCLFPKMKYTPRINYIKKVKEEKAEQNQQIKLIAEQLELSTNEVKNLIEINQNLLLL